MSCLWGISRSVEAEVLDLGKVVAAGWWADKLSRNERQGQNTSGQSERQGQNTSGQSERHGKERGPERRVF